MSSSESVRSACGLVLVCGFFMFFLGLYLGHVSVSKPGPSLSDLAEPLEFACVESEGSVVPLVRLTILGLVSCVHK